jgi:hypothetical protein
MGTIFADIEEAEQTIKALLTPENAPILPAFPAITLDALLPGDGLIFYGLPSGNQLTERLCVNKYKCQFHPPFHAALYEVDGLFHDVGQFTTNRLLDGEFRSGRRIDVIRYQMTDDQRKEVLQATILDTTVPKFGLNLTSYGIIDLVHFGFSFVGKGKSPVCSADYVQCLNKGDVVCSTGDPMNVAPCDIQEYAASYPSICQQFTLWVGPDYHR